MNLKTLEKILKDEPKYRPKQAKEAIFKNLISGWNEATNFSAGLRNKLNKECPLDIKAEIFVSQTKDVIKALMTLKDGLKIESVLMMHKDRNTVCVSSQVGCPLECVFCATGQMGFKRNLEADEIINQVLFFARYLKNIPQTNYSQILKNMRIVKQEKIVQKIDNIVFMGMGEPFLNYDNVISAIKILNDKDCFGLGARHFSISTIGIIDGIKKLANEKMEINLAISLHAPNNDLRQELMPINQTYPIEEILSAVENYIKKTKRRVMFEYLMIKGINDSLEQAEQLAYSMKKPLYIVNLISYNPTGKFESSSADVIRKFKEFLERRGIIVTQRYSFGKDIKAACGQLVGR